MTDVIDTRVRIRAARAEERKTLEELQRRACEHDSHHSDRLRAEPDLTEQIDGGHVSVAEEDGRIVGFAVVLPAHDGECELEGVFVEPERRRRGVGRALVADAANRARSRGATRLALTTDPQGLAFYEALGFHKSEERTTLALPPELADDSIVLVALDHGDVDDLLELAHDEDVAAFTLVRSNPDRDYVTEWIGRYERGWHDGSRAGFSIRDARDRTFLGFAAVVELRLAEQEGELGYMLAPSARGRGAAGRSVALLTRWCFDVLGLERLELQIAATNEQSKRVAERAGYRLEGVLRNVYFKEGRRGDVGVWARLRGETPPG